MNSLTALPGNDLDENDNADWHKSVLGDEYRNTSVSLQFGKYPNLNQLPNINITDNERVS